MKPLPELPAFSGTVVHGQKRGRVLGFPTANIRVDSAARCPEDGVYSCWLTLPGDGQLWGATVSVGRNPTFNDVPGRQVEAFIHDFEADLYGRAVELHVLERLRGMVAFATVDELVAQTRRDVELSRAIHALWRSATGR